MGPCLCGNVVTGAGFLTCGNLDCFAEAARRLQKPDPCAAAEARGYEKGVEAAALLNEERAREAEGSTLPAEDPYVDPSTNEWLTGASYWLRDAARRIRALLPQPSAPVGSGFVPRDPNAPPRYNGSGTPCDMDVGPCSCGATHVSAPPHPPAPQEAARMVEHHTRVMRR